MHGQPTQPTAMLIQLVVPRSNKYNVPLIRTYPCASVETDVDGSLEEDKVRLGELEGLERGF